MDLEVITAIAEAGVPGLAVATWFLWRISKRLELAAADLEKAMERVLERVCNAHDCPYRNGHEDAKKEEAA